MIVVVVAIATAIVMAIMIIADDVAAALAMMVTPVRVANPSRAMVAMVVVTRLSGRSSEQSGNHQPSESENLTLHRPSP